ncbi:MAG TPA: PBP1A family penicillin-binding protein [Caulobacterales bacterium]|nr:PBP1A family penicillin-binding protein [Caulobacterales bacterium]
MAEPDDPEGPQEPPEAAPEPGAEPPRPVEPETTPVARAETPAEPPGAPGPAPPEPFAPPEPPPLRDLPSQYFKAAGDPDEPPPEPDTSFWGQTKARAQAEYERAKIWAAPRLHKFSGDARAFGLELWRRIRGVRTPKTLREAAIWGGYVAGGLLAVIIGFFVWVTWDLPSTDDLWHARSGQSITFLDRNGQVILREGAQNAPPVDLASLPPYVPQAFIAVEDRRFYHHFGVDFGGLIRASATNLRAGHVVQGGSTLTQQLAKNLFLTNERSWRRKAQEAALAVWLETKFTKDEILALYLSRVYFGAGAYGIQAASERYFDRPARQLTLLQAAMLAGLVKAPSRLNPTRQDMDAARTRAEVVLQDMVEQGFISDAERRAALQDQLVVSAKNPAGVLSYYRDWIDPLLNQVIGTQRDAFIVDTTLDINDQRAAVDAVQSVLNEQGQQMNASQASLIAMDDEGGVRSMVGGRDYEQSQFNRAVQARRQPGSSFKFFIYLAAMEQGLTPWSIREDAPISIDGWTPGNYEDEYHGQVPLVQAFAMSYNMVAIRVAHEIGQQHVIDVAQRLGVRSPLHNYNSLALGAQEVTLLEMTQAYAAMASEGYRVEAHGIARIRRAESDEVMWSWRPQQRDRVIQDRELHLMDFMMSRVVQAGTGTHAQIPGREIGAKTGTGNDYRDAWFVGFVPGFAGGVWVGNDNFSEMRRVTGGSLPAEIWRRYMTVALRDVPVRPLQMPTPEEFNVAGSEKPQSGTIAVVGAPLGAPTETPPPASNEDHSLDFGPEG